MFSIITEDRYAKKYLNKLFMLFCFLFLWAVISFRGTLGDDTEVYMAYFYDSAQNLKQLFNNFFVSRHEPGYLTVQFINRKLIDNHVFHFAAIGATSLTFLFSSIKKYTPYVFLAIALYFLRFYFLRDLNQIRAAVALCIILYSIGWIDQGKASKVLFFTVLAALFHKTALIIIPFYYFNRYINKRQAKKSFFLLGLLLAVLISFANMKSLLGHLIVFYIPVAQSYVLGYLSGEGSPFNIMVAYQIVLFIVFLFFERILKEKQVHYYTFRNMLFASIVLLLVFDDFEILSSRLSTIFATAEIIVFPSFLYLARPKWQLKIMYFILYAILFYINVYKRLGEEYYFNL